MDEFAFFKAAQDDDLEASAYKLCDALCVCGYANTCYRTLSHSNPPAHPILVNPLPLPPLIQLHLHFIADRKSTDC